MCREPTVIGKRETFCDRSFASRFSCARLAPAPRSAFSGATLVKRAPRELLSGPFPLCRGGGLIPHVSAAHRAELFLQWKARAVRSTKPETLTLPRFPNQAAPMGWTLPSMKRLPHRTGSKCAPAASSCPESGRFSPSDATNWRCKGRVAPGRR